MNPEDYLLEEEDKELTPEALMSGALEADPDLLAAREQRDADLANTALFQGITDIGTGLASQGRVSSNNAVFDAIRKNANTKVEDVKDAAKTKSKSMADFIKSKLSEQRREEADKKWQLKYDQDERAIEATRVNREEAKNKPTDTNISAAGFGKRVDDAESVFSNLEKEGYDRATDSAAFQANAGAIAEMVPLVGESLKSKIQSDSLRKQDQAERNFINAILRKESGAAISPSEFKSAESQYFPRAGDSAEVKAQKKANRLQARETLKAAAGPAWEKMGGNVAPKQKPTPEQIAAELKRRGLRK